MEGGIGHSGLELQFKHKQKGLVQKTPILNENSVTPGEKPLGSPESTSAKF